MTQRKATWRGGPWDGRSIDLPDGMTHVPVLRPDQLRTEDDVAFAEIVELELDPVHPRMCPVVQLDDGSLAVDWHAGA